MREHVHSQECKNLELLNKDVKIQSNGKRIDSDYATWTRRVVPF